MQTTSIDANPFAILSFIIAPAILTNASSVLAMSTSNRLARAVDRARELTRQLEENVEAGPVVDRRLRELTATETRTLMLIRALRSFYAALGAFASATLLSLLGAVVVSLRAVELLVPIFEAVAVVAGIFAVGALVHGSALLVRETRTAVQVLSERAAEIRSRLTR